MDFARESINHREREEETIEHKDKTRYANLTKDSVNLHSAYSIDSPSQPSNPSILKAISVLNIKLNIAGALLSV